MKVCWARSAPRKKVASRAAERQNMHTRTLHRWQHHHAVGTDERKGAERRTWWVIGLTATMMTIEIAAGMIFGSMALFADGWHMGTHAAALGITVFAYLYARRHADNPRYSFGSGKIGALGGFASVVGPGTPGQFADLARTVNQHREIGVILLGGTFLRRQHVGSPFLWGPQKSRNLFERGLVPQRFVRGDLAVKVLDDVGAAVGAAEREIGAGPAVVETKGCVVVEDAAPARVEKGLGQFPEFGLQGLEPVSKEIQHLPVEHTRPDVLGGWPRPELGLGLTSWC